ncbi:MAG: DUF5011 domain-containing protein, partial [Patescibacteria group bacterium]|nr:DUF5011 domain-containing protein [Patescibacteria group bacterium]
LDYAELFPSSESTEPGDILEVDTISEVTVRKSTEPYSTRLIGDVSTNPASVIEGSQVVFPNNRYQHNPTRPAVALVGRVPVKINLENGPIEIGDHITSSSILGVGMKATEDGKTIGIALESYDGTGDNKILVFIHLSTYGGDLSVIEENGELTFIDPEKLRVGLASLGLVVNTNGVLEVDTIKARKVELKLIEIIDSVSGDTYCTWLEYGDWVKVQGECDAIEGSDGGATDTTFPVITLIGASPVELVVDAIYVEEGSTASDDTDGDITAGIVIVSNVDTSVEGSYTVTYNVTDAAGNVATEVVRTVNVVETLSELQVDITPPIITLVGVSTAELLLDDIYTEDGATATDDTDGDITSSITTDSTVDTSTAGNYTVTYNVSDEAGNTATEVIRTVNVTEPIVVDTIPPVITLVGTSPIELTVDDVYNDEGATAEDDIEGDITANIVTVSTVDTSTIGSYTVTYNVSDAAGNAAIEVTRVINVVDL